MLVSLKDNSDNDIAIEANGVQSVEWIDSISCTVRMYTGTTFTIKDSLASVSEKMYNGIARDPRQLSVSA